MPDNNTRRSEEITDQYFSFLEKHVSDVVSGDVPEFLALNQIAGELFISHQHLSDTIQRETGHHPCHFYDLRIIDEAKKMLLSSGFSVAEIARILTYDPSNFSKFFKKFVGQTPKRWRDENRNI